MKTQSPDTSPEAERIQIELLRNATGAQRFALVRSLWSGTRWAIVPQTSSGEMCWAS